VQAAEKLDRLLAGAIQQFGPRKPMPEVGGKSLASELRTGIAGLKRGVDELKLELAGAVSEFSVEMQNGKEAAKRIRAEAADMRQAVSEILGNENVSNSTSTGE
jgi:hypothetical protein